MHKCTICVDDIHVIELTVTGSRETLSFCLCCCYMYVYVCVIIKLLTAVY